MSSSVSNARPAAAQARSVGAGARWLTFGVPAAYLALALALYWHGAPIGRDFFGNGTDPIAFVWYFNWWPYAIAHGLDPFETTRIWHGIGLDLAWTTSLMVPSLLFAPLTLTAGPLVSYNVFCLVMPAAAAEAAFLLLRAAGRRPFPSVLGGLLYGFSSYESTQLLSHINLAATVLPPLALLLCLRRVQERVGRTRFVVLLAAIALAQLGTSDEILLTAALFGALFWLLLVVFAHPAERARLLRLVPEIAAAGLLTCLVAAPFLYYFVIGFAQIPGELNNPATYSLDPLSLFVPTIVDLFGGHLLLPISDQFTGGRGEQGGYLGFLLVLIVGALLLSRQGWTRRVAPVSLVTLAVLVSSFGPSPHLLGVNPHIHLPWAVATHLPILNVILPVRLSCYLALCVAFLLAEWIAAGGPRTAVVGAAAVLLLLPDPASFNWFAWPTDPLFTPAAITRVLGRDKTVLLLPYGATGPGMAWQLDSDMLFNQSAGYAGYTPRLESGFGLLRGLHDGAPEASFADDMRAYAALHRLDAILIGPDTPDPLRTAIGALGWPTEREGDVTVVRVPPLGAARYASILGDYWASSAPANWIGRRIRVLTHGEGLVLSFTAVGRPGNEPAVITVDWPSGPRRLVVGANAPTVLDVPPDADLTIRSDTVFVPARLFRSPDWRPLSVMMSVSKVR